VTAASASAGTGVLRHCDVDDPGRSAVESKSNRSGSQRIRLDFQTQDVVT